MKNFLALFFCCGLVLTISACGPVYKTEYSFTAPSTQAGKTCANQCLDARQSCYNLCNNNEQECRDKAALDAKLAYLEYANTRLLSNKEIDRNLSSFENYSHCAAKSCEAQCADSHRICHVNCGGGVLEKTYCTSFCD